jgi:hypothetical protein
MSNIFESQQNGLITVYIYSDDHSPAHVHVFIGRKGSRGQADIKINLGSEDEAPRLVKAHPSISTKDLKKALKLVADHQELFLKEWNQIHGQKLDNRF